MSRHRYAARLAALVAMLCVGLVVALLGTMSACSQDGGAPSAVPTASTACPACACPPAEVVDPVLLAFLSKARAAHHAADLAEQDDDAARAIASLQRLVGQALPGGHAPPPEVREVLADTYARLAELRSARGAFDEANQDLERGLRLAVRQTHFRGRLLEVRGVVEERRAASLASSGDEQGAKAARARAVSAFERAIEIQAGVIESALADAGLGQGGFGTLPPLPEWSAQPDDSASPAKP